MTRKILSLLAILALVLSVFAFTRGNAHATNTPPICSIPVNAPNTTPGWVVEGSPYVTISNGTASISDTMKLDHCINATDTITIENAVAQYNALPAGERANVSHTYELVNPNGACVKMVTPNWQWWGVALRFNECSTQAFLYGEGSAGLISGAIASLCAPCVPFAATAAAVFAFDAASIIYLDSQCGNTGVYINETWALVWWDSQVC